jgi:hypothetical protein
MIQWLQGKKTYIVSGALAIAGIVFFFVGRIDAVNLTEILAASAAMTTFGAKFQRHLGEIVQTLQDIKDKNSTAVLNDATKLATAGLLEPATVGIGQPSPGPTVVVNVHAPATVDTKS